jgi:hypothetical protein
VRSTTQMLVVLLGGVAAGGLAVLAALPAATEPVPPLAVLGGSAVAALATLVLARRLQPIAHGRSRR